MTFMNNVKKPLRLMAGLAALALVLLALISCTSKNRILGYVYYHLPNDPTTLDPALLVDVNAGVIAAKMFNGLVRLGENMEIEPDIASDWTVSQNGLKYTFNLKKGVTFSSGREVKARDFKFSFERVLDPNTKSPNSWIFEHVAGSDEYVAGEKDEVEGLRVVDEHTLEIILKAPFTPFLGLLTMPAAYVVPLEFILLRGPDFSSQPVGSGPYQLKSWQPSREIVLDARQDYFERPPKAKGIVYRVIPEELTAIAEFELGNLDIIPIPFSSFSRYAKSPKWQDLVSSVEGLNTYYLGMNCERPPLDNPEFRRAINYAIDRARILATLFEGRGRLASGPVPEKLRQWPAPEAYVYDVQKARKIIHSLEPQAEAIKLYIPAREQQVIDVAEVIQAYLKDAGLDVEIVQIEWSAFKEAIVDGKADMFWLSWWADYPDPENFLFPTFHSSNIGPGGNRARYANEEVDKLIELGQHAPNTTSRNSYYEQAEQKIVSDAPWVFFWHRTDYTVRQPWVKNYRLSPVYTMDKGLEISL